MKKNHTWFLAVLFLVSAIMYSQKTNFEVVSPNGELKATIKLSDKIYYSIITEKEELSINNHLGLFLKDETLFFKIPGHR